jgi:hypothetical protein
MLSGRSLVFPLAILLAAVAIFSVTGLWKRTRLGRKLFQPTRRSPLRDNLLRSPGQTIHDILLDKTLDFASDVWSLLFIGVLGLYFPFLTGWGFPTVVVWLIFGVLIIWILYRLRTRSGEIRDLRLGLDGELATAEELSQLMFHGYYVFHDLPGDHFNIDHVVIGPAGVFAIETKTRSKPVGKGKQLAMVIFEDSQLKFPDYQESESIQQAKDQSKWLSEFLRKSVGKAVAVKPVLALPGWLVERRERDPSIMVINPKEAVGYVTSNKVVLDDQTIQQIKYQVEQRVRTVEPYKPL